MSNTNQTPIAIWLLLCCLTIFGMIVLGGVTRLTGSGLSMVQWQPILGILPPLNHAEWQETFLLYQQFPEYKIKNYAMSLSEFKSIFWFEYLHRLLGRSIGLIFFIPFVYFLLKKQLGKSLMFKLIAMFVLGGLQGLMGWYMVKSGLVSDPHVSQYRLTAHLALAVVIFSYMFWVALDLLYPATQSKTRYPQPTLGRWSLVISSLIFITVITGGFVAGTRAGFAFNTFPLMNGQLIPDGLFSMRPVWRNLFENIATVQFDHRVMATVLFILIPAFWWRARKSPLSASTNTAVHLLLLALLLQILLGISTLLYIVPVSLAATHQAGAIVLLTASLFVSHQLCSR